MQPNEVLEQAISLLELSCEELRMTQERVRVMRAQVSLLPQDQWDEALSIKREEITLAIKQPWTQALELLHNLDPTEVAQDGRAPKIMQVVWDYQTQVLTEALLWAPLKAEQSTPSTRTRRGDVLPTSLAQQTFQEMRNLGIALSDGPSGRRWMDVEGEVAMVHAIPDKPIHVRFSPSSLMLAWWSEPPTFAHLRAELREAGAPAVLLAHVAVGLILEQGRITVSLDELRHKIGWTRRESALVDEQLRRVWRMLLLLGSMPVVGKRNETYTDRRTRQVLNLVSNDPLIVVRGTRYPDNASEGTDVPYDVSLDGGAWLDLYRGNRGILTHFGDVLQLAKIPSGKPAGAWAQSIGLALNQRWRERASKAEVARVGEDGHNTVRFKQSFTRGDLLDMFRADPYYRDILEGSSPVRARTYWDAAITLLKNDGIIGHYAELNPLKARRQGWQPDWLSQPLDIRPGEEGRQAAAVIAQSTVRAKRKPRKAKA